MVEKGRKSGTLRFSVKPDGEVKKAMLAGDFTDWKPLRMRKQKGGRFVSVVSMSAGTHEYKFVFDGQWTIDPENNAWAVNPYGTLNSIAKVG
jgi:1,4-alpha-glucan branching enzyme